MDCPMSSVLLPRFTLSFRIRPARVTPGTSIFLRTSARMESSTATKVAADSNNNAQDSGSSAAEMVVQYVVLRRDLIDSWPLGSIVTQGCHASVAAIWAHKDDPDTLLYCSPPNIDSMHKVTLEVKGETQIRNLSEKLEAGGVAHKLWMEHPENIPTVSCNKTLS
ncbi:uncharacterized protein LOC142552289 [Primulina tabacum]|uniref:uncharacterized protein LOC142552289 n=1 Tax=Primulina tabacum TaxID=48773 RepID=UPI003F594738